MIADTLLILVISVATALLSEGMLFCVRYLATLIDLEEFSTFENRVKLELTQYKARRKSCQILKLGRSNNDRNPYCTLTLPYVK